MIQWKNIYLACKEAGAENGELSPILMDHIKTNLVLDAKQNF